MDTFGDSVATLIKGQAPMFGIGVCRWVDIILCACYDFLLLIGDFLCLEPAVAILKQYNSFNNIALKTNVGEGAAFVLRFMIKERLML